MSTRDDPSNDDISGERFETPTNTYHQVKDERQGHENEHHENKTSCSPGSNENVEDQTADATPVENDVDEGNSIPALQGNMKEEREDEESTGGADSYVPIHGSDDVADQKVDNVGKEISANSGSSSSDSDSTSTSDNDRNSEEYFAGDEGSASGSSSDSDGQPEPVHGRNLPLQRTTTRERFETPTNTYHQVKDERQGHENEHHENKTSCSPGSNEDVEDQTADATPVENDVDGGKSIPVLQGNMKEEREDEESTGGADSYVPIHGSDDVADQKVDNVGKEESSPNSDSSSSNSDSDEYHTADEGSASGSSNGSDGLPERDLLVNSRHADSEQHETVEVTDGPQKDIFYLRGSESDSGRQDDDNYHPKVISTNSDSSSSDSDSEEYFTADEGSATDSGYISSNGSDGLSEDADGEELLGEGDGSVGLPVFIPPAL